MNEFLSWVILVALTAAGLVMLVRQTPWVDRQMMQGKRPWACNLCMSFWHTLFAYAFWFYTAQIPKLVPIPAFALTLLLVNQLGKAQSKPDFAIEEIPERKES